MVGARIVNAVITRCFVKLQNFKFERDIETYYYGVYLQTEFIALQFAFSE